MRVRRILLLILLIVLIVILSVVGYIGFAGWSLYKEATAETPVEEMIAQIQSSPDYVEYEDISPYFLDAIVAIEDRRFYSHSGFDIISTTRAIVINVVTSSLAEGGSTITQQLAKNLYFSMDKEFDRKVAEVFVAMEIEKLCDKDEILALYVNVIYFGNNCYGVGAASQYYFGKAPADLTLDEATLLAGLPKAPSSYANDPEKQYQRQAAVLDAMVSCGYLTQEEANAVLQRQGQN